MNFNKCKKLVSMAGLAVGLAMGAGTAQSANLYSFEDDDLDFIVRGGTVITAGPILLGDVFVSALEIPVFTINGVPSIPAGREMTGVAAAQLVACTFGGLPASCAGGPGTTYIFAPAPGGVNAYIPNDIPAPLNPGSAVALFLNETSGAGGDRNLDLNRSTNPASNCVSFADCMDQVSRGDLFQVDGFGLDPDEFWVAVLTAPGAGTIGTVLGTNNNLIVAIANVGLSTTFNANGDAEWINIATGLPCGNPGYIADGCVQMSISATITGGSGLSNGAFAHSDFDASKFVVPEPGSLALLGLGLAGLGFASRRKKAA